jgi:DNA-binding FadR family transcriptional regulator
VTTGTATSAVTVFIEGATVRRGDDVVHVPKASALVAKALRRQIITGVTREGESLPAEAELMQRFSVSRPTLREALRVLESESLIQVRRGAKGGARVKVPDGDVAARYAGYVLEYRGTTMSDVYQARAILEVPLARMLAETATDIQVRRLRASLAAAEADLQDLDAYGRHDVAFHLLMAELVGNQTLAVLVQMVYHVVGTARQRHAAALEPAERARQYQQIQQAHTRLVDLVGTRDPDAAEVLWRKHLAAVNRHYLERPISNTVVEMME